MACVLQESSLETYAVSIESDSLNQDDKQRDDEKKELKRTRSTGDVAEETVRKYFYMRPFLCNTNFHSFAETE